MIAAAGREQRFRKKRPHYYPLVCFQFWTGARPSEVFALRWGKVDLKRGSAKIDRSWTAGFERYTKTRKSRRDVRLHCVVIDALRATMPPDAKDDDFVFTTEQGSPLDIRNFFQREWLPMLRRLRIRPRPFYKIPLMREQAAGHIIQFSSVGGRVGAVGRAPYSAANGWVLTSSAEIPGRQRSPTTP